MPVNSPAGPPSHPPSHPPVNRIAPYDLYLDHAATSLPRSERAIAAATQTMTLGSAQRGLHTSATQANEVMAQARQAIAQLLGLKTKTHTVCFLPSTTAALNQAILGLRPRPRRIALDPLAHNATYRPVCSLLEHFGIEHWVLPHDHHGKIEPDQIQNHWTNGTDLVVLTHASNVTGLIQPAEAVIKIATDLGAQVVVDAAQTAGVIEITELSRASAIAFGGHKGLKALPGIGALVVANDITLEPLIYGGTGGESASEKMPLALPMRLEAGTPNLPAIAAMATGAKDWLTHRVDPASEYGQATAISAENLREAIAAGGGIPCLLKAPRETHPAVPIASFTLPGLSVWEAADILERCFSLQLRHGLHCAPLAHHSLGTFPTGTLRVSAGATTTQKDLHYLSQAIQSVCYSTCA